MKSMTGFGKATRETAEYQLEVEIKSVNQRFLDMQIRSPKLLNYLENDIRQLMKQHLSRGRVEVFINLTYLGQNQKQVFVDWNLIDELMTNLTEGITQRYGEKQQLQIGRLLETLTTNESFVVIEEKNENNMDELTALVLETVHEALAEIEKSRQKEGTALEAIIQKNSDELKQVLNDLQQFVELYEQEYQEKYQKKLEDYLGATVDQQRLLTELAILLERGDIHEELDELLQVKQPVGRELDFLIQEMNREINTIGSKSSAIEIKNQVIQLKTILEKIREQIQNIE